MAFSGTKNVKVTSTESDALTGVLHVKSLRWVSVSAAAGHKVEVEDSDGNVIFESVADGANFVDSVDIDEKVNGVVVSDLDSGSLYVYTGSKSEV